MASNSTMLNKYGHIIARRGRSTMSKSSEPYYYVFFLDYQDPNDIPFDELERVSGKSAMAFRGMMRSALNSPKIFLTLVDLGVDQHDIPTWFPRPPGLELKKRPPARAVPETGTSNIKVRTKHPAGGLSHSPAQKVPVSQYKIGNEFYQQDKPPIWKMSEWGEKRANQILKKYENNTIERYLNLTDQITKKNQDVDLELFIDILKEMPVPLYIMEQQMFNSMFFGWLNRQRSHSITREDVELLKQGLSSEITKFNELVNRNNEESVPIERTGMEPLIDDKLENKLSELRETIRINQKKELIAIADLMREQRERNDLIKQVRHGNILAPIKINRSWFDDPKKFPWS